MPPVQAAASVSLLLLLYFEAVTASLWLIIELRLSGQGLIDSAMNLGQRNFLHGPSLIRLHYVFDVALSNVSQTRTIAYSFECE
jgi:hypothetical protein